MTFTSKMNEVGLSRSKSVFFTSWSCYFLLSAGLSFCRLSFLLRFNNSSFAPLFMIMYEHIKKSSFFQKFLITSLCFFIMTQDLCLEKAMTPHSNTLAWRIPGMGEPAIYGATQSWTRLKWLSSSSSIRCLIAAKHHLKFFTWIISCNPQNNPICKEVFLYSFYTWS